MLPPKPKGGLGRGLSEIMAAQNAETPKFHPLLDSLQFLARTRADGGATMNANTGAFVDPSKPDQDTYIVGQEPDTKGNPIPTKKLDESNDLLDVVANRKRIVEQTGGRGDAALGSWKTSEGVDLDASAMKSTEAEAMGLAQERGEKAIWSSKKFRESGYQDGDIMNPKYKG